MSDDTDSSETRADGTEFTAGRCPDGHLSYPRHPRCPECGQLQGGTVDLRDRTATVVTWTTSHATPPGVREPNHLGIVEFDVDGTAVRALVQFTTGEVETGDAVRPVYVAELRDPTVGVRAPASQSWDGYRFEPLG